MNCLQVEALLCDYIDGTLPAPSRHAVEQHLASCASCAELARDSAEAVSFLDQVEEIDPPGELLTNILFHLPTGEEPVPQARERWSGWFVRPFNALFQPRFVMGLAMTILSFSMVGRVLGLNTRQLTAADLDPIKVWAGVDDKLHRGYDRAVKYYENLRLVFEIQSRLNEWSEQEEQDRGQEVAPLNPVAPPEQDAPRRQSQ